MSSLSTSILNTTIVQNTKISRNTYQIKQGIKQGRSLIFTGQTTLLQQCAIKIFPQEEDQICINYLNESRFVGLKHSNIIPYYDHIPSYRIQLNERPSVDCSMIIMELAHCDLKDILSSSKLDSKLARTFFHHMFEGLSFLHKNEVSHMDLKLENVLLGHDYNLKIADLDGAYKKGDLIIQGRGSFHFRAPEVIEDCCRDTEKADIFSLGVILFCLNFGSMPFLENAKIKGIDLFETLMNDPSEFWTQTQRISGFSASDDFINLFNGMMAKNPKQRFSLDDIRKSRWYSLSTYKTSELKTILDSRKLKIDYLKQ